MARAFAIVPLVTPAQLAIYRFATASLSYTSYLDCGAANVLGVQYPERVGGGDLDGARRVAQTCWRITVAGAALAGIVTIPLVWIDELSPVMRAALAVSAVAGVLFKMLAVWYRARLEFSEMARIEVIVTVLSFVATLVATYVWQLTGLLLGTILIPVVGFVLGAGRLRELNFDWRWSGVEWSTLTLGVRLWLTGFLIGLVGTGDIFVLTRLLDISPDAIGPYALASMLGASLDALAAGTGQILATWLSRVAGEAGNAKDPRVLSALESSLARDSFSAVVLIIASNLGLALLVPFVLPSYASALPLFSWLGLGVLIRRWLRYPLHMISLVGRTRSANVVGVVNLALMAGGMYAVDALWPSSLFAIAAVVIFSQLLGSIAVLTLAFRALDNLRLGVVLAGKLVVAHMPLLAVPLSVAAMPDRPILAICCASIAAQVGCLVAFRFLFPTAAVLGWRAVISPALRLFEFIRRVTTTQRT